MLKGYLNRLQRIAEMLNGEERVENIRIVWGQDNDIPPASPGVIRTYWVEYAPEGIEVDWDPAQGYYPPLPSPEEKPLEDKP